MDNIKKLAEAVIYPFTMAFLTSCSFLLTGWILTGGRMKFPPLAQEMKDDWHKSWPIVAVLFLPIGFFIWGIYLGFLSLFKKGAWEEVKDGLFEWHK